MLYLHQDISDPPVETWDTEAAFLQARPLSVLVDPFTHRTAAWRWRLPNPVLDPFTQPDYNGRYRCIPVMVDNEQWGWLIDPDTEPPADVVERHQETLRQAAQRVMQNLGSV